MRSYILKVELSQDEDGRWNAAVPALPSCYTWGNTKEEALAYIQDAVRCCVEDMIAHGEPVPEDVEVIEAPVVSITLRALSFVISRLGRLLLLWRGMASKKRVRLVAMPFIDGATAG